MKKFLYLFLFIFLFNNNAHSESGNASEYKIKIYKIELCETGSTVANCLNPVTLYEGDSGTIDIANTCLLYTSPSPRDRQKSRMPSSA